MKQKNMNQKNMNQKNIFDTLTRTLCEKLIHKNKKIYSRALAAGMACLVAAGAVVTTAETAHALDVGAAASGENNTDTQVYRWTRAKSKADLGTDGENWKPIMLVYKEKFMLMCDPRDASSETGMLKKKFVPTDINQASYFTNEDTFYTRGTMHPLYIKYHHTGANKDIYDDGMDKDNLEALGDKFKNNGDNCYGYRISAEVDGQVGKWQLCLCDYHTSTDGMLWLDKDGDRWGSYNNMDSSIKGMKDKIDDDDVHECWWFAFDDDGAACIFVESNGGGSDQVLGCFKSGDDKYRTFFYNQKTIGSCTEHYFQIYVGEPLNMQRFDVISSKNIITAASTMKNYTKPVLIVPGGSIHIEKGATAVISSLVINDGNITNRGRMIVQDTGTVASLHTSSGNGTFDGSDGDLILLTNSQFASYSTTLNNANVVLFGKLYAAPAKGYDKSDFKTLSQRNGGVLGESYITSAPIQGVRLAKPYLEQIPVKEKEEPVVIQ